MTPLGHGAVSLCLSGVARPIPRWPLLLGGLAPDLDFLFLVMPWFDAVHRVATHNLVFVALVAVLVASVFGQGRWLGAFGAALLGGLLHLLIDASMDTNPHNGIGVALLWPLSDQVISPFNLLDADAASPGWGDPAGMLPYVLAGLLWELPFYLGAGLILFRERRLRGR